MRMIGDEELELIRRANAHRPTVLEIVATGCAYSCCGRGWLRRDGGKTTYRGWIDNFTEPEDGVAATFMLYSSGIGKSYVIACRAFEVLSVVEVADG